MSDFHKGSWNPAWSIETILTGLLSFMLEDELTTGGIRTTEAEKKLLAPQSHAFNIKNPKFKAIFPEYADPGMRDLPNMGDQQAAKKSVTAAASQPTPIPTDELRKRIPDARADRTPLVVGAVLLAAVLLAVGLR